MPVLERMRVLTEADGIALGNLCQTCSTLIKAQEKLIQQGILYKAPSGYMRCDERKHLKASGSSGLHIQILAMGVSVT